MKRLIKKALSPSVRRLIFLVGIQSLFVLAVLVETALGAGVLMVTPSTLEFGSVLAHKPATLTLRLKASGAFAVNVKVVPPSPYTVNPAELSMQALSYGEVTVTLPDSAPIGEYAGKLLLKITPLKTLMESTETMEVAVTGNVVEYIPQDFTVTGEFGQCPEESGAKNCTVSLHLTTSGPNATDVRTQIFEIRDKGPETMTLDKALEFKPKAGALFRYDVPDLSRKTKKLTLRIVIDPGKEVREENEDNNEITIPIEVPR